MSILLPEATDPDLEAWRIAGLHRLALLDTPPEAVFDAITRAAAEVCNAPIALVSLIDTDRHWVKSNHGLPGLVQIPRSVSFCAHVIADDTLMEVADAQQDPRFAANPFVTGNPNVRFYAGAPIVMAGGERIGTVCVIDMQARQLSQAQRRGLENLSRIASACLIDRSERLAASAGLAASEARFRHLYEATPAILHSTDPQRRVVHVSDYWLRAMGYARHEVVGRPLTDFLDAESGRHAMERVLPEVFRTGSVEQVSYRMLRKDGSLIDVLAAAILERDAEGRPLRTLAVLDDVTERKRLAAELLRTHADLNAIVDNVPALLGYWDRHGVNRFANREYQAAVGMPIERIVGRPMREVYDAIDPTGYEEAAPHIARVLQGERQEFEHAMLTVAGLRQLHMTYVPDQSQGDEVAGFYGLAYDITGRKALELRVAEAEAALRSRGRPAGPSG